MPRLNGLTVLRFFAAFWVLSFHLELRSHLPAGNGWVELARNGPFAMSLFFVLSGAVLAYGYHQLQPEPNGIRRFYLARLARIYPAYAVVHLLALFLIPCPGPGGAVNWIYINTLSVLGLQSWFTHAFYFGINGGTWSVSVEFFFYALFPALLPLLSRLVRTGGALRVAFYLSLVITFFGLADFAFNRNDTFPYYFSPLLRLPEFMLGMVAGLALVRAPARPGRPRLNLIAALVVVLAGAFYPISESGLWMRENFLMVPALAWLIYAAARAEQQLRPSWTGRFNRCLIYLGESSFGLFLFQLLVLTALDTNAGHHWRKAATAAHSVAWVWGCAIALSLAGGIALHELVEKPAQRALLRRWKRTAGTAAAAPLRS